MNNIINYIDNYILLYEIMNKSIDNLKNYESIKNLDIIKNKKFIKDIDEFINGNIKYKYKKLIDFIDNIKNEMTLIYKNNDDKIKLFGEELIENNKDNCFLLIDDKINELCSEYNFNKKEKYIKLKLIEENEINNMSNIFSSCESLSSLSDISKWNTNNVNNMSYMFSYCESLSSLSDINNSYNK